MLRGMRAAWTIVALVPALVGALLAPAGVLAQAPASGPRARAHLRQVPIVVDMGPVGRSTRNALRCRADTRDIGFSWSGGLVKDRARSNVPDPFFATFAESDDATFLVALEPADAGYTVELMLGDPETARGPVSIAINDIPLFSGITTAAGEKHVVTADVRPENGRLAIRLRTDDCRGFALSGLTIRGPANGRLGKLFGDTTSANSVPPAADIRLISEDEARQVLAQFADFLVDNRPHQGGFSYHGAWYQNAYAVRTLLAAARLLDDGRHGDVERWRRPAVECLDAFVAQQGRDSNWFAGYNVRPACHTDDTADSSSANLADIGSMITTLAMAIPEVDKERRDLWIQALTDYFEQVSLPRQMPGGAFSNGRFAGTDYPHPYTVATASQASALAALYEATQDFRFLDPAQKAARWLADNSFASDGNFLFRPHDQDQVVLKNATDFGNLFYVADALIQVRAVSADDSLCAAIDRAMDRWIFAANGLKSRASYGYWWTPHDAWGDSKMGGMLYVLAGYHNRSRAGMVPWLRLALGWMADPDRRASIGITRNPASVRGDYALPATGYAGLGVAALLTDGAGIFSTETEDAPADSAPATTVPVSNGN
jgi:hypothetical protein